MRILLIEDNPIQSQLTLVRLERYGCTVVCAASLEEARVCFNDADIDVILLDLSLPDGCGMDSIRAVQSWAAGVPIVVFTADDDQVQALDAVKSGAQDYLVKGVASEDAVVRCLRYALERNRAERIRNKDQERLKVILENSYNAFLSMDSNWRITEWNSQAERSFGWQREDMIGQSMVAIFPPHLRKQYLRDIEMHFSDKEGNILKASREFQATHADGRRFPIEVVIFRIKEDAEYRFCAFVRDITERIRSNAELERLVQERTDKLMQTNEQLQQFAKIAAHDLQEPLRAVQGFVNLLAESTKDILDKESSEFMKYILDGAQRMQLLIQSVLTHSQINSNESEGQATNCNAVIEEVLLNLNSWIHETGTVLEVDKLPTVAVERSQLIQLFQNLIGNAIKYRRAEAPFISIRAERSGNQWLFSIQDNGIGIAPTYFEKIFDMFARLHGKTQYPGTGIGLAICKKIVVSHGGHIWVESKPGEGSIFLFTLPAVKKVRRAKMKENIDILLVEDTPSDIRLTEEALKRSELPYHMVVVNDGADAMEYLHKLRDSREALPDIILLDLNMPRKNGHEVLAEIKNDADLRPIPVVLLTVSERDEDVLEALRLKMNYYIAKPVTAKKLTSLLKSIHELHSSQVDNSASHTEEETHVRLVLAGNPHTAPIALEKLFNDQSHRVRRRVAENTHTPTALLNELAHDAVGEVRIAVSENPNTDLSVLEMLSKDASEDVRLALSSNSRLPEHLLRLLAEDDNVYVSADAKKTLLALKSRPENAESPSPMSIISPTDG